MIEKLYAKRMEKVSGEAVKEILAMMADPTITSFGGGSPAKESFPVEVIEDITEKALKDKTYAMLQYGQTEGWRPLREAYLEHMLLPKGVKADISNIATVTGSTQGFDLVTQVFVDPGDVVLVEAPTFLTAITVLSKLEAKLIPVAMDEKGICLDDLEAKIKAHIPKLLYTIPTFQNPTGCSLPAERRKKIAELASEYGMIVVEDDPYCELRYRGEAIPPIKSFDETGNVVLINSFSKIVAPGIRVGAMAADSRIIDKMMTVKQCCDTHTANLTQEICAEFLRRGLLPGHIESIRPMYLERMNAMTNGIDKFFPEGCRYTQPEGGLFTWVEVPEGLDTRDLVKESVSKIKVAFVPGSPFFLNADDGIRCMRLNFSSNAPQTVSEGIEKLGTLIKEKLNS